MFFKFLLILIAYLAGSIPTGVWYSKFMHATDVRTLGSGNSGTTNIGRNFGAKAAIFVAAVDVLKGWLPVLAAKALFPNDHWVIMAVCIACVVGHAYPIFARFNGGKIVATSIGVLLGFHFWTGIGMLAVFVASLYLTSIVSISSMVSYSLTALYIGISRANLVYAIGFGLIALFMIYRHRTNIQRLLKGEERRIKFGLRKAK
ncbi:MAG: glycerol-3-phosphate 1-O-acyltransferase PlsY [Aerococcaceae bacterium]|nr:glycerol-3-phosphate 1-O-acyltransferase PlsY [Aerococcaceae bacterium]